MVDYNWKKSMKLAKKEADELSSKIRKLQGVKTSHTKGKFTVKATSYDKLKDALKVVKKKEMKMIKKKNTSVNWKLDYWGLDF